MPARVHLGRRRSPVGTSGSHGRRRSSTRDGDDPAAGHHGSDDDKSHAGSGRSRSPLPARSGSRWDERSGRSLSPSPAAPHRRRARDRSYSPSPHGSLSPDRKKPRRGRSPPPALSGGHRREEEADVRGGFDDQVGHRQAQGRNRSPIQSRARRFPERSRSPLATSRQPATRRARSRSPSDDSRSPRSRRWEAGNKSVARSRSPVDLRGPKAEEIAEAGLRRSSRRAPRSPVGRQRDASLDRFPRRRVASPAQGSSTRRRSRTPPKSRAEGALITGHPARRSESPVSSGRRIANIRRDDDRVTHSRPSAVPGGLLPPASHRQGTNGSERKRTRGDFEGTVEIGEQGGQQPSNRRPKWNAKGAVTDGRRGRGDERRVGRRDVGARGGDGSGPGGVNRGKTCPFLLRMFVKGDPALLMEEEDETRPKPKGEEPKVDGENEEQNETPSNVAEAAKKETHDGSSDAPATSENAPAVVSTGGSRRPEVEEEMQVYGWKDITLREIVNLTKDLVSGVRQPGIRMHFKLRKQDGTEVTMGVLNSQFQSTQDRLPLSSFGFQIGDAIAAELAQEPPRRPPIEMLDAPQAAPKLDVDAYIQKHLGTEIDTKVEAAPSVEVL